MFYVGGSFYQLKMVIKVAVVEIKAKKIDVKRSWQSKVLGLKGSEILPKMH